MVQHDEYEYSLLYHEFLNIMHDDEVEDDGVLFDEHDEHDEDEHDDIQQQLMELLEHQILDDDEVDLQIDIIDEMVDLEL